MQFIDIIIIIIIIRIIAIIAIIIAIIIIRTFIQRPINIDTIHSQALKIQTIQNHVGPL